MKRATLFVLCAVVATLFLAPTLRAAIVAGSSSGVFQNPSGQTYAPWYWSGMGTSQFFWGDGSYLDCGTTCYPYQQESLAFLGQSISGVTDTAFEVGTLTFHNRITLDGTQATQIELDVTIALTLPTGFTQPFSFPLFMNNSVNPGPPCCNDIITLPSSFTSHAFGSGYTLELLGFRNLGGSPITQLSVPELFDGNAYLWGEVTGPVTSQSDVPEPSSGLLLGTALAGIAMVCRRRLVRR